MERVDLNSKIPAMRFLGFFFDPSLKFQYHVQQIMSKVSGALNILRTVNNVLLTPIALKSLYYTLFHSHLIYAIPNWTICNLQLQKDLHIKQKMAIRTVRTGPKYNDHTEPTFKYLKFCHFQTSLNFLIFNLCNGLFKNSFLKLLIPLGSQTP
jgi:hypothetical protein